MFPKVQYKFFDASKSDVKGHNDSRVLPATGLNNAFRELMMSLAQGNTGRILDILASFL